MFVAVGVVPAVLLIALLIVTVVITIMCYMRKNNSARRKNHKLNTVDIGENRIYIYNSDFCSLQCLCFSFCVQGLVSQTRWAVVFSLFSSNQWCSLPTQWENRRTGDGGQGRSVLLMVNGCVATCVCMYIHLLQVVIVIWKKETPVHALCSTVSWKLTFFFHHKGFHCCFLFWFSFLNHVLLCTCMH